MSNDTNARLLERAAEVMQQYEGTDLETAIQNNIDNNDLDMVRQLVTEAEAEMAREEYYASDIYGY